MDLIPRSLFIKISAEDKEFGAVLKDNDIVEDTDIKELCYESIKELLPGGGKRIVQRAKVWKVLQNLLKCAPSPSGSTCTSTDEEFNKTPQKYGVLKSSSTNSGSLSTDEGVTYTPKRKLHAVLPSLDIEASVSMVQPTSLVHSVLKSPSYTIYTDAEIRAGAKAGRISDEVRKQLVRGTIHNMKSLAAHPPFNRLPSAAEMEEMAKSLIIVYPCLSDDETRHGVLFKQLKRRLSNTKPVKKPQGPNPKKKRFKSDEEKKNQVQSLEDNDQESDTSMSETASSASKHGEDCNDNDHGDLTDNQSMMERHKKALKREMGKKKPNAEVLNVYLNKEFPARRTWLQGVPASDRCVELLDMYPCFTDHVEVIEEARRVLEVATGEDRFNFMGECVDRLLDEVESLIYFGINTKGISPPKSSRLNAKIMYLMKYLPTIFGRQKASKKTVELLHELKESEDPDVWIKKHVGIMPMMVVDKENAYVVVGKRILYRTDAKKLDEAVIGFLACFYLLDYDYPKQHEVGMNILQYYVFKDRKIPEDIAALFDNQLSQYKCYKAESV